MNLTGSVALVTGAAHRLGRAIALALAREGASIALHYGGSADAAGQTRDEIAALGVGVRTFQADLADPAQIGPLVEAVLGHFGRLDVLVNSAASFRKQRFDAISADDWDAVMAVNLRAPFLLSQAAARVMQRPGLIVNITDLSGLNPWTGYAHHAVSKAGLVHLTKIAARELGPRIRVNTIAPGAILPPPGMDDNDPRWEALLDRTPMKRGGNPEDIGRAVVFLAKNDGLTGVVLPVDGGDNLRGGIGR